MVNYSGTVLFLQELTHAAKTQHSSCVNCQVTLNKINIIERCCPIYKTSASVHLSISVLPTVKNAFD